MIHVESLAHRPIHFTPWRLRILWYLSFVIAVAISVLMLSYYEYSPGSNGKLGSRTREIRSDIERLIRLLGLI